MKLKYEIEIEESITGKARPRMNTYTGRAYTPTKIKEKDLKIIRKIDYLRNNTILNLYGGNVR